MKLTFISTTVLMVLLCNGCSTPKAKVKHRTPVLTSEWKRVIYYLKNHLNDFCIFQDYDKIWQAMGVLGEGYTCSYSSYSHSTSPGLLSLFTNHDSRMTGDIGEDGIRHLRAAPFVIAHDNQYFLFLMSPLLSFLFPLFLYLLPFLRRCL